jgi:glycosyltransferase involved in cell wall biosynthesis
MIDQIIVVDSGSTDQTAPIAISKGAEVLVNFNGMVSFLKIGHQKCHIIMNGSFWMLMNLLQMPLLDEIVSLKNTRCKL